MYSYEHYEVNETTTSYLVTGDFSEDIEEVEITKKEVEELQIQNEEPEKLAILLATIEAIRHDNCAINKKIDTKITDKSEFIESLKLGLSFASIEYMISEVSQMKYYEIKEYFS